MTNWTKMEATVENAMEAWAELAFLNGRTDAKVNDLLEEIAGEKYIEDEDDPIYLTIRNLTNAERRRFLEGCDAIMEVEG